MPILSFLALLLLIVGFGALLAAASDRPRWYWGAALATWVFSFLGGFSIGLYTLSATFILTALAIGHSLGLIRRTQHSLLAVIGGLSVWLLLITTVDDYWLFFPLVELFDLLL